MSEVKKNKYGFYELKDKPSEEDLQEYYSEKYYQNSESTYQKSYTKEEVRYIKNKIRERYYLIDKKMQDNTTLSLLDIGCGEGWALSFFREKGWNTTGIDYSGYACKRFNPECLNSLLVGDVYNRIEELLQQNESYHVVWLDNILEHVLEPKLLLSKVQLLLKKEGLLMIEVPNDFSILQEHLYENDYIDEKFWITIPDHISYFNKEGLVNLANVVGFEEVYIIGDYPIDLNLLNPNTNYISDGEKGKSCHRERVAFENLIHDKPMELVIQFYQSMIDLGIGRQITALFRNTDNEI